MDRGEVREGVPDLRRRRVLVLRGTRERAGRAVRLGARGHVVGPAHVVPVQEVGQVGPGEAGYARGPLVGVQVRRSERGPAGGDQSGVAALRRPARDDVQVGRLAPAEVRLEQVVLQHEVPGVRPVVGDLAGVVPAHDVQTVQTAAGGVERRGAAVLRRERLADEAVHLPLVDVGHGAAGSVRAARVRVARVVVRADAPTRLRIGHAGRRDAVPHGDPISSGERPEVGVEGSVLLHDHDHVLDRVDARGVDRDRARRRRGRRGRRRPGPARGGRGAARGGDGAGSAGGGERGHGDHERRNHAEPRVGPSFGPHRSPPAWHTSVEG